MENVSRIIDRANKYLKRSKKLNLFSRILMIPEILLAISGVVLICVKSYTIAIIAGVLCVVIATAGGVFLELSFRLRVDARNERARVRNICCQRMEITHKALYIFYYIFTDLESIEFLKGSDDGMIIVISKDEDIEIGIWNWEVEMVERAFKPIISTIQICN